VVASADDKILFDQTGSRYPAHPVVCSGKMPVLFPAPGCRTGDRYGLTVFNNQELIYNKCEKYKHPKTKNNTC